MRSARPTNTLAAVAAPVDSAARAREDAEVRREALRLAGGGLALGGLVLVAPRPAARLFGFPAEHVSSSALLLARLYAIREAARGIQLTCEARSEEGPRKLTAAINLAIDATDAVVATGLLARRRAPLRPAVSIACFAAAISALWARFYRRVAARPAQPARPPGPAQVVRSTGPAE